MGGAVHLPRVGEAVSEDRIGATGREVWGEGGHVPVFVDAPAAMPPLRLLRSAPRKPLADDLARIRAMLLPLERNELGRLP